MFSSIEYLIKIALFYWREYVIIMHTLRRKDRNGQQMKGTNLTSCAALLNSAISAALCSDFWPLTVISNDLRVISDMEKIESIMGAHVQRSLPEWVCIPQKSLAIAPDFWNINSFGWTPFRSGTHDGFSKNPHRWCPGLVTYTSCYWHLSVERNHHSTLWWPPVCQLQDTTKTPSDIYRRGIAEKKYLWKMHLESHRQCTWSMWGT